MAVQLQAVTYDAHDPVRVAQFWGGLLGRQLFVDGPCALLPGSDTQVGLSFVAATTGAFDHGRRLHLHLTSDTPEHQQRRVEEAIGLGARHLDVGQTPDEGQVVLADPEGNPLCVVEPGNSFLDGCGPLGEVACDGTRGVGLFWQQVLGWSLVWDRDEETSIQSPRGGTKVSWGGPPVAAKQGRNRQRFLLAATDVEGETTRLVELGATVNGRREHGIELLDPEGNEFHLTPR
jgi:predicted enzyme related to lactoylglutathione lyase